RIHLIVIDPRERAAGERPEHVRVHPRTRPRPPFPPGRHLGRRQPATSFIGARRLFAVRCFAPPPPARIVERHSHGDRKLALTRRTRLGGAPKSAARGVCVLVKLGRTVLLRKRPPGRESTAH